MITILKHLLVLKEGEIIGFKMVSDKILRENIPTPRKKKTHCLLFGAIGDTSLIPDYISLFLNMFLSVNFDRKKKKTQNRLQTSTG